MRTQISIDLQEPDPDQFLEETEGGKQEEEGAEAEGKKEHKAVSEWLTTVILNNINNNIHRLIR